MVQVAYVPSSSRQPTRSRSGEGNHRPIRYGPVGRYPFRQFAGVLLYELLVGVLPFDTKNLLKAGTWS